MKGLHIPYPGRHTPSLRRRWQFHMVTMVHMTPLRFYPPTTCTPEASVFYMSSRRVLQYSTRTVALFDKKLVLTDGTHQLGNQPISTIVPLESHSRFPLSRFIRSPWLILLSTGCISQSHFFVRNRPVNTAESSLESGA